MLNDETAISRGSNVFHGQWDEMLRLRRSVLATWELEDIHDLRVASRRFRAALNLFAPYAPPKQVARLQKSVRKLTRALGGLRNIDEARVFFSSSLPPETCPDKGATGTVAAMLSEMRECEVARVEKTLRAFKPKRLDPLVRKMAAGLTGGVSQDVGTVSFTAMLSDTSLALFQRIHDQLAAVKAPENAESRHALRIAIKKWRYFLEIVASILGRDYGVVLERLKRYQSVLGRMNDMVELSALCRSLELDPTEQQMVEEAFRRENGLLWEHFLALLETQPLRYSFHL